MPKETKECPYCFTEIDARAIVCPQCRRELQARVELEVSSQETVPDPQGKMLRKSSRLWAALVAIVVLRLFCVAMFLFIRDRFGSTGSEDPGGASLANEPINTISIESGEIVQAEGQIVPERSAVLSFLNDTRVAEVFVAEGDAVEEGALLVQAENGLTDGTPGELLSAPFAGIVAGIEVDVGETAMAGSPVIAIADLQKWQIQTTDLTELDVLTVAIGDRAEILIDALPGVALNGTVIAIGKTPLMERGDVTYPVTIALEDPGELPLFWGMTTFITIQIGKD